MRRNYLLLITLVCCWAAPVMAQTNAAEKQPAKACGCGFSSINQLGIVSGDKGNYLQGQTINGFRYKTWFAGVGIGLDGYHKLTAPLFLDIRKNLFQKINSPFVYVDGGIELLPEKTKTKGDFQETNYKTGAYYDVGIGYHIGLKNRHGILMSAGYSAKKLEYTKTSQVVCVTYPCYGYTENYSHQLGRLSLKVGYRF